LILIFIHIHVLDIFVIIETFIIKFSTAHWWTCTITNSASSSMCRWKFDDKCFSYDLNLNSMTKINFGKILKIDTNVPKMSKCDLKMHFWFVNIVWEEKSVAVFQYSIQRTLKRPKRLYFWHKMSQIDCIILNSWKFIEPAKQLILVI
jgi:hypothetical protein